MRKNLFLFFFLKSESIYHLLSKHPGNKTISISTNKVFQLEKFFSEVAILKLAV